MELRDDPEIELICPRCGYRLRRTASRLCRATPVVCAQCGTEVARERGTGEPRE